MSKIVILFFLVAFTSAVLGSSKRECGPRQEWRSCGTACPPTCKNPNPEICTLQCVQGCFCQKDLVLNEQQKCVELSKCNK